MICVCYLLKSGYYMYIPRVNIYILQVYYSLKYLFTNAINEIITASSSTTNFWRLRGRN